MANSPSGSSWSMISSVSCWPSGLPGGSLPDSAVAPSGLPFPLPSRPPSEGRGCLFGLQGQAVRLGQVYEPCWDVLLQGKVKRLPFRRKDGEGIEDRPLGGVGRVDEKCHRRLHSFLMQERQHLGRVRRTFHEHHVRPERRQRGPQTAGAAGSVVADAEDVHTHHNTSRQERYRSFQSSRSFTTVCRYSCQTTRSCTGSLTMAPVMPAARSAARKTPSPK